MAEDKNSDQNVTPDQESQQNQQKNQTSDPQAQPQSNAGQQPPYQQGQPGQQPPYQQGQPLPGQQPPYQQGQPLPGQPPPYQQGQPLPGQPPPGEKKSYKGCLIGCLVVLLITAIGLSVAALLIARNTDDIFQWLINRITGEEFIDETTTVETDQDMTDETTTRSTETEPADETGDEPTDDPTDDPDQTTMPPENAPEEGEGEDIEAIERFPGSILVEAWNMSFNETTQDFVQYATTGDLADVRQHFENIVDRDWTEKNVMTLNEDVIITAQSTNDEYNATLQITITQSSQYEDYLEVAIFQIMEPNSD